MLINRFASSLIGPVKLACIKLTIASAAAVICFSACSSKPTISVSSKSSASIIALEQLERTYGRIENPELNSYLSGLGSLLWSAIPVKDLKQQAPKVKVIQKSEAIALSLRPNLVVISPRLLELCRNEASFAFIIAHEFAHHALGHLDAIKDNSHQMIKEYELQADRVAFVALERAGFNINAALQTFESDRFYENMLEWQAAGNGTHPSPLARMENLISLTASRPSALLSFSHRGAISSRSFKTLQNSIVNSTSLKQHR